MPNLVMEIRFTPHIDETLIRDDFRLGPALNKSLIDI